MDDADLVGAARRGDREACAWLFRRHAPRVLRALRGFPQLSMDEVDDVVQEAFIRAFSNLGGLREPERFPAWILMIAHRQALLRLARERRRGDAESHAGEDEELAVVYDPAEREADALATEAVRRLVESMPDGEEKLTVVRFYYGGDCTASELAAELGVAKGTVTSRLTRFRARVKRQLAALLERDG